MAPKVLVIEGAPEGSTGAIIWWALSGTVEAPELAAAWASQGLPIPLLPILPSPDTALARAVAGTRENDRLVRQMRKGGWIVSREIAPGEDYHPMAKVKLNAIGHLEFAPGADPLLERAIRLDHEGALLAYATTDISGWLADLARSWNGVPLRESGGIYFIPPHRVPDWRRATAALGTCSGHRLHEIPAMRTEQAIAAILEAVSLEAEGIAAELEEELTGELGERALRTRATRCKEVREKVRLYEGILGRSMGALQSRLEALDAGIAAAALAVT
jgi:hypothetical protein